MSPAREDRFLNSHPPASTVTGEYFDGGPSVRRATGTTSKAPPLSSQTHEDTPDDDLESPVMFTRKRKVIEHGIISNFDTIEVIIYAQTVPWWILALDISRVSRICFPMFECIEALLSSLRYRQHDSPIALILEEMDPTIFVFQLGEVTMSSALLLVCGSVHFFLDIWDITMSPKAWIFCTDKHQKMRKLPDFPVQLYRILHFQQGGPTSYEMLWASSDDLSVNRSNLIRTIGDFLDHSIRPGYCSSPPEDHFSPSSILPMKGLFSDVCYPSSFSASGFGIRPLVSSELSSVFGIPSKHSYRFELHHFPLPPVQILDVLLLRWSELHVSAPRKLQKISFCVPTPTPLPDESSVFFHTIRRSLPPSWASSAPTADKAAKSDDASVSESLWNNRITKIWPLAKPLTLVMRGLMLRRQRRLIYLEFQSYLRERYSDLHGEYFDILKNIYRLSFGNQIMGVSKCRDAYLGTNSTCNNANLDVSGSKIKKYKKSLRASKFLQLRKDIVIGGRGLRSICDSSFFNWDNGSTLLFWRWHASLQRTARDGFPVQIMDKLPHSFKKSRLPKSNVYEKILSKLKKGLERGYLIPRSFSTINNLIDFFAVPKAEDIRMVQNGSSCGLNKSVWASNFWLPNAASMTRVLGFSYKAVDLDLGEMFLNFPLDDKLISYSGMDLTPYKKDLKEFDFNPSKKENSNFYVVNTRNWMGLRPSPEWSCRFYYLAEEFIRGNEKEKDNPLRWDKVILNSIGNADFNPALPNVFKWN